MLLSLTTYSQVVEKSEPIIYNDENNVINSPVEHTGKVVRVEASDFTINSTFNLKDCQVIFVGGSVLNNSTFVMENCNIKISDVDFLQNNEVTIDGGELEVDGSEWTTYNLFKLSGDLIIDSYGWQMHFINDQVEFAPTIVWEEYDFSCMDNKQFINENASLPMPFEDIPSCDDDLPVELIYFSSELTNFGTELYWATATEINSDYFDVEFSLDNNNWVTISRIEAAGFSNVKINYNYLDSEYRSGVGYYRLRQVDFDGEYEYFGPIQVHFYDESTLLKASVYPVPQYAGQHINVRVNNNNPYEIVIFNEVGQIVHHSNSDKQVTKISSTWGRGMFILHVIQGSQKSIVKFQLL
ncbi:hypothetical protein NH26_19325 [Flammeovirga pacifica]|uniref:Secretion system C-terminal sorting domain-containing protein n=2 Tax=Flammeovirga pacifica TaxID=915059 RepID=A0A1S1Z5J1_FLAPC|nr:hypothetical protein NH26_19325 [Flammeovirga pacifica]